MKPWAEDNFLERLMPQLRQVNRVRLESCPDSELLTAFVEDQVAPFVRGAITAHLSTCPECSEVCARLANFARATVPQHEPEWTNVEKRLDNAMDIFLASKAAERNRQPEREVAPHRSLVLRWKEASGKPLFSWRLAFASAGALALVIVGGVLTLRHTSTPGSLATRQTPAPQIVVSGTEPAAQPAVPVTPTNPPAPQTANQTTRPQVPVRELQKNGQRGSSGSRAPKPRPEHPADQPQVATSAPSAPTVVQSPNDRMPGANNATLGRSLSTVPAAVHFPQAPANSGTSSQAAPLFSAPATLSLAAGERVWIQVSSMTIQPDGTYKFRGSLLRPLGSSGLPAGAEVSGASSDSVGSLVLVSEFALQGQRYALANAPAGLTDQAPGAGKAVQFQNGQVWEVLLTLPSTYQKVGAQR
jgi:hypothetical protein